MDTYEASQRSRRAAAANTDVRLETRSGGRSVSRSRSRSRSVNKRTTSRAALDRAAAGAGPVDEGSKWIHRDKLARIENEELQAAGIVLPKARSQSRPRRDRSTEKLGARRATDASDHLPQSRSRKSSTTTPPDDESAEFDLQLPQDIVEDPNEYWISSDTLEGKTSRIPIAKNNRPPVSRKMSGAMTPDDELGSKTRSRSSSMLDSAPAAPATKRATTEVSPKKPAANGARKASNPASKSSTASGRPKTRSGRDARNGGGGGGGSISVSNTNRPTTRSGELSPSTRAPEGDPPWMVSAYKPDPRLPPDQQLLPTVARRLQQEKWEKEGKFGNVYDKDFRPLTDDGFAKPPEQRPDVEIEAEPEEEPEPQPHPDTLDAQEWPLRAGAKSPTPSRPGTSSYSTMPKIQDTPSPNTLSPKMTSPKLPSPRLPPQPQPTEVTRVPTAPEQPQMSEKKEKSGCGCCVVM